MSSRATILDKIKQNQPSIVSELPELNALDFKVSDVVETFKSVLKSIGGDFVAVSNY